MTKDEKDSKSSETREVSKEIEPISDEEPLKSELTFVTQQPSTSMLKKGAMYNPMQANRCVRQELYTDRTCYQTPAPPQNFYYVPTGPGNVYYADQPNYYRGNRDSNACLRCIQGLLACTLCLVCFKCCCEAGENCCCCCC